MPRTFFTKETCVTIALIAMATFCFAAGVMVGGKHAKMKCEAAHAEDITKARTLEVRECTRLIEEFITGHDPLFKPAPRKPAQNEAPGR